MHPGYTVTEATPQMLERQAARAGGTGVDEVRASLAAATSIGRLVTAAEVADVVAFLCSPRSVAVTGDAVAVGGGARGADLLLSPVTPKAAPGDTIGRGSDRIVD